MLIINRYLRQYPALLSICATACLLAACVTTGRESLRASVARLDDASSHFSTQLQYQGDDSRRGLLSRDADAMAKAAHNLDRSIADGNTRTEVENEYRRVTRSYQQLHAQLADEGYADQNKQVLVDFDRVTTTYRNVEAAMNYHIANSP